MSQGRQVSTDRPKGQKLGTYSNTSATRVKDVLQGNAPALSELPLNCWALLSYIILCLSILPVQADYCRTNTGLLVNYQDLAQPIWKVQPCHQGSKMNNQITKKDFNFLELKNTCIFKQKLEQFCVYSFESQMMYVFYKNDQILKGTYLGITFDQLQGVDCQDVNDIIILLKNNIHSTIKGFKFKSQQEFDDLDQKTYLERFGFSKSNNTECTRAVNYQIAQQQPVKLMQNQSQPVLILNNAKQPQGLMNAIQQQQIELVARTGNWSYSASTTMCVSQPISMCQSNFQISKSRLSTVFQFSDKETMQTYMIKQPVAVNVYKVKPNPYYCYDAEYHYESECFCPYGFNLVSQRWLSQVQKLKIDDDQKLYKIKTDQYVDTKCVGCPICYLSSLSSTIQVTQNVKLGPISRLYKIADKKTCVAVSVAWNVYPVYNSMMPLNGLQTCNDGEDYNQMNSNLNLTINSINSGNEIPIETIIKKYTNSDKIESFDADSYNLAGITEFICPIMSDGQGNLNFKNGENYDYHVHNCRQNEIEIKGLTDFLKPVSSNQQFKFLENQKYYKEITHDEEFFWLNDNDVQFNPTNTAVNSNLFASYTDKTGKMMCMLKFAYSPQLQNMVELQYCGTLNGQYFLGSQNDIISNGVIIQQPLILLTKDYQYVCWSYQGQNCNSINFNQHVIKYDYQTSFQGIIQIGNQVAGYSTQGIQAKGCTSINQIVKDGIFTFQVQCQNKGLLRYSINSAYEVITKNYNYIEPVTIQQELSSTDEEDYQLILPDANGFLKQQISVLNLDRKNLTKFEDQRKRIETVSLLNSQHFPEVSWLNQLKEYTKILSLIFIIVTLIGMFQWYCEMYKKLIGQESYFMLLIKFVFLGWLYIIYVWFFRKQKTMLPLVVRKKVRYQ